MTRVTASETTALYHDESVEKWALNYWPFLFCHVEPLRTILDKMDEKLRPPLPPFQWWKKWRAFVVARIHHWIRGRGASISHFILSKIVVSIRTTCFTQQKQWGLYENKVTSSLAAMQRPGHWADNCEMIYIFKTRHLSNMGDPLTFDVTRKSSQGCY